jgi:hypothetical protein
MTDMKSEYNVLVKKCEGNTLLEKPKHRFEDNIKMFLSKNSVD